MKNILFLLFISLCLVACTKTESVSKEEDVQLATLARTLNTVDPSQNYVIITSSQLCNSLRRDSSYNISAYAKFTDASGTVVNTGPVTIGNRVIQAGADNLYSYNFKDSTFGEGKTLLGNDNISVDATEPDAGSSALRSRTIMVVPKDIYPSSMSFPNTFINRGNPLPLTWSPDPGNQFQKVNIEISYMKGVSQYNASGMPASINHIFYQVTDNGSFTIPQTDISRFPAGSYVTISISRAWLSSAVGKITYISVVEAHTIPLLVIAPSPLTVNVSSTPDMASSTVSGGNPPYKYEWKAKQTSRTPIYGGGDWVMIGTNPTVELPHPCGSERTMRFNLVLKVTDATLNTASVTTGFNYTCF